MNIANRIVNQAIISPGKDAIRFPKKKGDQYHYEKLSFKELDDLSNHYCQCLIDHGVEAGDKVLLFIKPCLDFPTLTFSLFKMGAIPVLIDPGMGRENLLNAISQVKPQAIIAEPIVHLISLLYPSKFKSIKTHFTMGMGLLPRLNSIRKFKTKNLKSFKTKTMKNEDMAAILFTSGGTGIPKGVVYTHGIFNAQTDTLQEIFNLSDSDIDIPGFPLFSFFTMAMGMTSCIPDMNPSKPAKCDPKSLVQNILDNGATFVAGSPAIWERVAKYCYDREIELPSVKYVVMFGAPVSNEIHEMYQKILPHGDTYTPYGATECLPVSNINGKTILKSTRDLSDKGMGTCIGIPSPYLEVGIIAYHDKEINDIGEAKFLEIGEIGEIVVKGPVATPYYYEMPDKTREAKIYDNGGFWHRMGDMGRLDDKGRLWFYGRKSHRFMANDKERFSVPCEAIFNKHPLLKKSALIKYNEQAAIVIERNKNIKNSDEKKIVSELNQLAKEHEHTKDIHRFFFCDKFPVDVRHNIKIDRLKLSKMANEGKLS